MIGKNFFRFLHYKLTNMNLKRLVIRFVIIASIIMLIKVALNSLFNPITILSLGLSYGLGFLTKLSVSLMDEFLLTNESVYSPIKEDTADISDINLDGPFLSEISDGEGSSNNGEGSSKTPDNGEGSSKTPITEKKSLDDYGYRYSSDDSMCYSDSDDDNDASYSKNINKPLYLLDKEGVKEILEEAKEQLEEYKTSGANVPAAKEQIRILEAKIQECEEILNNDSDSSSSNEEDSSSSKNKSKVDKGKGIAK
jgi:hypothetical protein